MRGLARKFSPKRKERTRVTHPKEDDAKLAERFAKVVDKELGEFLLACVLFGSCATDKATNVSDIDVLLVVDDVKHQVTPEVTQHYRNLLASAAHKVSTRLHLNTLKLSSFWEYVRQGDPVVINMLRDGHPLVDRGIFGAMQMLLDQGRVRPTREAVWTYYSRSTVTLQSARKHILGACNDLYWAAVDASHAALMTVGVLPPTPEHIPDLLEKELVKRKLLGAQYPKVMRELYHLSKAIQHREVRDISGEQYEAYWLEALKLVDALRTIVESHPPA